MGALCGDAGRRQGFQRRSSGVTYAVIVIALASFLLHEGPTWVKGTWNRMRADFGRIVIRVISLRLWSTR